jgi:hypothetical protein
LSGRPRGSAQSASASDCSPPCHLALLLHGQLYGIQSIDPATFISVKAALLAVSALAALVPACKAMRIDPVGALRLD